MMRDWHLTGMQEQKLELTYRIGAHCLLELWRVRPDAHSLPLHPQH
jgi:hypothetical protein